MELDRWQAEVLGNVAVLDCDHLLNRLALDPVRVHTSWSGQIFCLDQQDVAHDKPRTPQNIASHLFKQNSAASARHVGHAAIAGKSFVALMSSEGPFVCCCAQRSFQHLMHIWQALHYMLMAGILAHHSVATLLLAMAEPQPNVLKHESIILPASSTYTIPFVLSIALTITCLCPLHVSRSCGPCNL